MKVLSIAQYPLINHTYFNSNKGGVYFCGKAKEKMDSYECCHKSMSGKEFRVFASEMTDLYTGEPMMLPEELDALKHEKAFSGPMCEVVKNIERPAEKYLTGVELQVFRKLQQTAIEYPRISLTEAFNVLYPKTNIELQKKQKPYFNEIVKLSKELPNEYKVKIAELMKLTKQKLNGQAVKQDFSLKEFTYQVNRFMDGLANDNFKDYVNNSLNFLNSKEFKNAPENISLEILKSFDVFRKFNKNNKKKKMIFTKDDVKILVLEDIKNKANHNKYKSIVKLCDNNIKIINHEDVHVPFKNKSFIYDLDKILTDLPDQELREKILDVAKQLPTSTKSMEAFILKYKDVDANLIGTRLFEPSLVSIEHLLPASQGGSNLMQNCALAKRKYNNARQHEPLYLTLQQYDIKNQQLYVDNLLKLVKSGKVPSVDALKHILTIEREGHIKLEYQELFTFMLNEH